MAKLYGVDPLRYFLMREVSFGQDGSYSHEAIVTRCNAELANSFGNLAQRVLSMIYKNLHGVLSAEWTPNEDDLRLHGEVRDACSVQLPRAFQALSFSTGIEDWMRAVFSCNQYVDTQAPWGLKKTDPQRMAAVLYNLFACVRHLAIAIQPVVPDAMAGLLDQIGVPENERSYAALTDGDWYQRLAASGFRLAQPTPVFPRLELDAETSSA